MVQAVSRGSSPVDTSSSLLKAPPVEQENPQSPIVNVAKKALESRQEDEASAKKRKISKSTSSEGSPASIENAPKPNPVEDASLSKKRKMGAADVEEETAVKVRIIQTEEGIGLEKIPPDAQKQELENCKQIFLEKVGQWSKEMSACLNEHCYYIFHRGPFRKAVESLMKHIRSSNTVEEFRQVVQTGKDYLEEKKILFCIGAAKAKLKEGLDSINNAFPLIEVLSKIFSMGSGEQMNEGLKAFRGICSKIASDSAEVVKEGVKSLEDLRSKISSSGKEIHS